MPDQYQIGESITQLLGMMILKMLSLIQVNPIMNAISEVCVACYNSSVLLTKRERDKVKLNSKVTYFRGALNSMIRNLEDLTTDEADQYSIVLGPFVKELVVLAETCDPAQKALNVLLTELKDATFGEEGGDA